MEESSCIFCSVSRGKEEAAIIHEDRDHMAFLDLYPVMKGQVVVIPKEHEPPYIFSMDDEQYIKLLKYAKFISVALDSTFDTGRTAMVIEGTHVEHPHVKLYPLKGTSKHWSMYERQITDFIPEYEGYITTKSGPRAKMEYLKEIQVTIREKMGWT